MTPLFTRDIDVSQTNRKFYIEIAPASGLLACYLKLASKADRIGLAIGHEFLDDFGIAGGQNGRATGVANELLGSFDHAMLFAGLIAAYFTL